MDNITRSEYNRIMDEHEELVELILTRTKELAIILHGRYPFGECCETDFDINADGTLLVQFETYYYGELDLDSYHLPLEFVFSEDYRKNYGEVIEKEKHDKEQLRLQNSIEEEEKKLEEKEYRDKAEYERLKKKYEAI